AGVKDVLALSAVTFFFIEGPSIGWAAPATLVAGVLALIGGAGFLMVEGRSSEPMLPLVLFRIRDFSLTSATGFALNFAFYGQLFFLNVYLQKGLGLNAAQAGLRFLPETAGALLFATLVNRRFRHVPPRNIVIVGTTISALGMLSLALFGLRGSLAVDLPILAMIGMGITTPPFIIAVMLGAVPHDRAGIASGALNAGRQVGGLLGVAMLGALIGHASPDSIRIALALAALAMAVGTTMAFLFSRTESNPERLSEAAAEAMA
ncbi:MFS transporter, partial [bacterium]